MHRSSKTFGLFFVLLAICLFGLPAQAEYGGDSETMAPAETSTYVFLSDQSTVVQTGGIAGVHETYPIEGQFRLSIDFDAGTASFSQVDANLTDESSFLHTRSLGVLFNMTKLVGTIAGDTTIDFAGRTADGTDTNILLRLTFTDDLVHLTGETIPPPNSADFFYFNLDAVALRKYGGGTGEPNDPYLIYTADQINAIGADANDWDKHFKLMADIDLAPYTSTAFNIIGSWDVPFTGVFDGNDKKISNFSYNSTGKDRTGLFGNVGYSDRRGNPQIKDLGLIDPNVDAGTGDYVGPLVGHLLDGNITGCYVEGGRVSGNHNVSGLIGRIWWGTITNCHSTGSVTGDHEVGGLVGTNYGGTLANCYSTDSVTGDRGVGGLVGWNWHAGEIVNCYAAGDIAGNEYVGGLVGRNQRRKWVPGRIRSCYSVGRVTGSADVGGLVGSNWGAVEFSFWDIETSGQTTSAGGAGKTTAEMQTASTFLDAGWDFVDETTNGSEDTWWILEGQDYPRLWWEPTEANFIVVDDFESYNDLDPDDPESKRIFTVWIDGYDSPTNGSLVDWCRVIGWRRKQCHPKPVHGGAQSMDLLYSNTGGAAYSEATMTLVYPRDWTEHDVGVLSLWFYGDPNNAPEPMYVGIANANGPTAVVYHDNPDAVLINEWTEWTIDLQEFADQSVDLTNVDTISIGFGDKNNPQAGSSGFVFFDDIRLYRLAPEPEP